MVINPGWPQKHVANLAKLTNLANLFPMGPSMLALAYPTQFRTTPGFASFFDIYRTSDPTLMKFATFNIVRPANRGISMIPARLSFASRLVMAVVGLSLLGLLLTAKSLTPDPRGFGTHEQLGLTPCSFYRWTGRLCPTCGATTAWAHAMHGDLAAATNANLAGTLLCFAGVIAVPWLLASASLGRWWVVKPTMRGVLVGGSGLMLIAISDWIRRAWFLI